MRRAVAARFLVAAAVAGAAPLVAVGRAAAEAPAAAAAPTVSGEVKELVVTENTKTTTDTVLYVADVDVGDDWDAAEAARVEKNLVSCGLFKQVAVHAEPHPKGGVKVKLTAHDKHSWIVAPTYYDQPTNRGFGVGFGENNLFGENKKLLLYGQIATGDSFFVGAYIDPSIGGSPFSMQLDTIFKKERVIEYAIPTAWLEAPDPVRQSRLNYINSGAKLGVTILRRLELSARLRGAWVSYDDDIELLGDATPSDLGVPDDVTTLPKPGKEGWDVSTEVVAKWDRRANWYGVSEGSKYQIAYESSRPALGSDFDYWYAGFSFEQARRFRETGNFIVKGYYGTGENQPFQQEFSAGGTSQRGYKNRQFRGDTKVSGTAEVSAQLFSIKGFSVRTLAFWDSTWVTFRDVDREQDTFRNYLPGTETQRGRRGFRNSVGVGTRFYIRQIVLPLLGLDLGYGLEGGGAEIYLAIGLTDV